MEAPTQPLTLSEDEREILRRRIPEAAAWVTQALPGRLIGTSLRTRELMPDGYSDEIRLWDAPPDLLREWIEHVSMQRAKAVSERALRLPSLASALASGFILAHDVGVCVPDELATGESPFFDRNDNSAWDTWLLLVTHESETRGPVWLSWIDRRYETEVDTAARLSATECLFWVDIGELDLL